jgi:rRNA-processing protein FCF1
MEDIIEPTMDYDFTKIYFGPPSTLAGGAYFAKIMYSTNKPLLIQTPKSLTKQGFVKSGKKVYTDLMFDNNDTVFINWIENLESKCQELVYLKRESWFETKLEKDDIETAFTSPFKIFKSGKYYLLRVNVKQNLKIYDEMNKIIQTESITNDKTIISILEIQGLKFTSRNFQIEIELKQSMVVSPDPFLDECFIKTPKKTQPIKEENIKEQFPKEQFPKEQFPKEQLPNKLNNIIKQSVEDLKTKPKELEFTNNKFEVDESIDLEVVFDKPLEKKTLAKATLPKATLPKAINKNNIDLEEANIVLDVEELEDPSILKEVDLSCTLDNTLETLQLKKPNQVYYEIYQTAREKAKDAKKNAIVAYLEMKNIKKTYMLDDIDESDSEFEEFASKDSSSEISDTESLEDN